MLKATATLTLIFVNAYSWALPKTDKLNVDQDYTDFQHNDSQSLHSLLLYALSTNTSREFLVL